MATMEWQWIARFAYSTLKEPRMRSKIADSDANYLMTTIENHCYKKRVFD